MSAGSAMAPQSSGNGPDGGHPPITRSPMAQERGMCLCVLACESACQGHSYPRLKLKDWLF